MLGENAVSGHFTVDVFGEDDMSILVVIVHVFVRVFNLVGIVWHSNLTNYYL